MVHKLPDLRSAHWLQQPELQALFRTLASGGGEGRVAGGAVRNALLGVPVADVDVATDLSPDRVTSLCRAAGYAVHPTGIDHGTVTVVINHKPFEVTTLRHDVATDGRRATVAFTSDWRQDAMRRDFTMNALYCDAAGNIYDYTDGYPDIRKRKVKFVGAPTRRITEDYLRILRFFRFHAHYGRGALDAAGLAACTRKRMGLHALSAERVTQEMLKLLAATSPVPVLQAMAKSGILAQLFPHTTNWRVLRRLPLDPFLRLAVVLKPTPHQPDRLRLSNAQWARITALWSAPNITPNWRDAEQRAALYELGTAAFSDAAKLAFAQSQAQSDDADWARVLTLHQTWIPPKFPVDGTALKTVGVKPGPAMGVLLRQLEDWWIVNDFKPTVADLLSRATSEGASHA